MSKDGDEHSANSSYGELLGEYLAVVNEISVLLDSNGRPNPAFEDEYKALAAQKHELLTKLEQASNTGNESDIQTVLDAAFENQANESTAK